MPAQRLPMRQVREVLRLKYVCGHSGRRIAAALGISRYTVAEYLRRAAVVGITWPVPPELDDTALERKLFTPPGRDGGGDDTAAAGLGTAPCRAAPPRRHVAAAVGGVSSRATGWIWLQPVLRPLCEPGAAVCRRPCARPIRSASGCSSITPGRRSRSLTPSPARCGTAQIFVAALGASNFTYAEARWTQGLADWIGCHVNAFTFLGGVTRQMVCDNLKAGVTAACRYEPGINRSYQDMAAHYGTAIVPTRVRKPRDKAKVEVAVQLVQRWVLARLRHRRFFSLAELNAAIGELIDALNNRPMRHLGTSRRALFEATERSALLPLPTEPYVYAEWRRCRAGIDYHVEVYGHWYSVPYRLMRETIEARITEQTVELFHRGTRVASHIRSPLRGRHTTIAEHMPSAHRRYADWTPARLMREAAAIGPSTAALVEQILHAKPHPEQGFRACLGILRSGAPLGRRTRRGRLSARHRYRRA